MTTPDDEIMCDCSGTTKAKIMSLVEQGITTLDDISRKTGTNSGCGACEYDVQEFLDHIIDTNDS
ncbi:MAG: (2Fe-2S)-binding protein [Gammaproteobacteria bacterium]|nr:(2Fe-2S)-binding protein [Gammaproteobacteria bacterium]